MCVCMHAQCPTATPVPGSACETRLCLHVYMRSAPQPHQCPGALGVHACVHTWPYTCAHTHPKPPSLPRNCVRAHVCRLPGSSGRGGGAGAHACASPPASPPAGAVCPPRVCDVCVRVCVCARVCPRSRRRRLQLRAAPAQRRPREAVRRGRGRGRGEPGPGGGPGGGCVCKGGARACKVCRGCVCGA